MIVFTQTFLIVLFSAFLVDQICCLYNGADMVGVGYNVLFGNPDGGVASRSGSDPGIETTKHIFQLTRLSDGSIKEESIHNLTCANISARSVVLYSPASYRDNLFEDVHLSPDTPASLKAAAFSLSSRYKDIHTATANNSDVFIDKGVQCKLGTMTYKTDLAAADRFSITRHFAAVACGLPLTYNASVYASFLDQWGTHVVDEVYVGIKQIRRYVLNKVELIKHIQFYDPHLVHGTKKTIAIDVKGYPGSKAAGFTVGSVHYSIQTGSYSTPQPIGVNVVPISEAMKDKYWKNTTTYGGIGACASIGSHGPTIMANIERAVAEYSTIKSAPAVTDIPFEVPLVWPAGTYGLPMAKDGCPTGGVTWFTGWVDQDTNNDNNNNFWSPNAEALLSVKFDHDSMKTQFCMVTTDSHPTGYGLSWPKGTYCILMEGHCPSGFSSGYISWLDHGGPFGGTLPNVNFENYIRTINYCCRSDGDATKSIILPTEKNFVLYRYGSDCQLVEDMRAEKVHACFDTYKSSYVSNSVSGHYPSTDGERNCDGIALNYCHYAKHDDFGVIIG